MFKAIGRAIVFIVDGIAKICAFILLTFGMFIPLIYTILFFVIKIVFKLQFTSTLSLIFFIGLSVSVLGGLYFAFGRLRKRISGGKNLEDKKRKMLKSDIANDKKVDKQQDKKRRNEHLGIASKNSKQLAADGFDYSPSQQPVQQYAPQQPQQPVQQYAPQQPQQPVPQYAPQQPQQPVPQYAPQQPQQPVPHQNTEQYKKYCENQRVEFDRKYGNTSVNEALAQQQPQEEAPTHALTAEAENLLNRLEGGRSDETPLIFRLKNDPNTFVYEYCDRLQFFKKQGNKMILIKTQYKKSTGEIKR